MYSLIISVCFILALPQTALAENHDVLGSRQAEDYAPVLRKKRAVLSIENQGSFTKITFKSPTGELEVLRLENNHTHQKHLLQALSAAKQGRIPVDVKPGANETSIAAIEFERGTCGGEGLLTKANLKEARVQRIEIQHRQLEFIVAGNTGRPLGLVQVSGPKADELFATVSEAMKRDALVSVQTDDKGQLTKLLISDGSFNLKTSQDPGKDDYAEIIQRMYPPSESQKK